MYQLRVVCSMPIDVCHLVPLRAFPQPPSTLGFVQAIPQEGKHLDLKCGSVFCVREVVLCAGSVFNWGPLLWTLPIKVAMLQGLPVGPGLDSISPQLRRLPLPIGGVSNPV